MVKKLPFIEKGERVTDEQGNTICYAAETIYQGDQSDVSKFERWEIDPPKNGDLPDPRYVRFNDDGSARLCIEGIWR